MMRLPRVRDFIAGVNLNVDNTGGTVCFTDSSITIKLDCVAFDGAGEPHPSLVPAGANFGTPFALPGVNLDNQTLVRTISRGCATAARYGRRHQLCSGLLARSPGTRAAIR